MLKIHHNVIAHYFYKKAPPWMPDRILSKPLKATVLSLYKRPPLVILGKGVLKICSKFTGEHPCQSVISIKLQGNFDLRPAALLKKRLWHVFLWILQYFKEILSTEQFSGNWKGLFVYVLVKNISSKQLI